LVAKDEDLDLPVAPIACGCQTKDGIDGDIARAEAWEEVEETDK
jgi:hypothetical protein